MKTKRSLATIIAVFAILIATAVEKPKMNVQSLNSDQILVTVLNKGATNMEVTIFDNDDNIVYYKMSTNPINKFNKIFDVENLENGTYVMKVNMNGAMLKSNIEINRNEIKVGACEESPTPYFAMRNKTLSINHLNFENNYYKLEIYTQDGLIYRGKASNSSPFHSGYDLSELSKGSYIVVLSSGNKEYNYRFEK